MILLSIETSCDETSICIVKRARGKNVRFEVLSHKILSQVDLHRQYGGVFPSLAKREHARTITQLIAEALDEADLLVERSYEYHLSMSHKNKLEKLLHREPDMRSALTILFEGIQKPSIDAIAVTKGPGLEPALWVGINCALALKTVWDIPVYPINHMEGHIMTGLLNFNKEDNIYELSTPEFPATALLVSGGHTELVKIPKLGSYKIIGNTRDDAVGEAFDKVARLLGLPYPGGPEISNLANKARTERLIVDEHLVLPRPMIHSKDLNMSFSGLKTSVLVKVKAQKNVDEKFKKKIAVEFENSVTDVLTAKTKQAIYETGSQTLIVGGGVSANDHLRTKLKELANTDDFDLFIPDKKLAGDNALMIACVGLFQIANDKKPKDKIIANGSWSIEES